MPFALAIIFLVLLKLLGCKVFIKQYLGVALFGGFLSLLFSPQCLCFEERERILGALTFSLSLWGIIFVVISIFLLFKK